MGHNKFSDWSEAEMQQNKGLRAHTSDIEHMKHHYARFDSDYTDDTIDWVERGAVSSVKDDGNCAACWAHSAVDAIEAANFIATEKLVELSTQQLIDCDPYDYGCEGGFMVNAFEYATKYALMTSTDYPYVGVSAGICLSDEHMGKVKVARYINVVPNDAKQLRIAVSMGPVVAAVASTDPIFQFYKSGVITSEFCGTMIDSSITIVGYGAENGHSFWLVKGTYGPTWGEKGYAKIGIAEGQGICGINTQASIPFTA